jgi:uncharacterized membrane protein
MNKIAAHTRYGVDLDLVLVTILTIATLGFFFVPRANETPIRPLLGLILVLFTPGYALIAALFPAKQAINNIQRIALSFGLSIVVVLLTALCFNYLPSGIQLVPIAVALTSFTAICAVIANWRRHILPPKERFSVEFSRLKNVTINLPGSDSRTDKLLSVLLVLTALVLASTIAYTIASPNSGENFTEFYLLGSNGTIGSYPTQYHLGEQEPVDIGIVNHEQQDTSYKLFVRLNDTNKSTVLYSEDLSIADNQTWQKVLNVKPDRTGSNMKLEFLLYLDNNLATPYRELYLWIQVS